MDNNVTSKDILIGLINTLPDNICRDIYYFVTDKEYSRVYLTFGLVNLTYTQYNKLIWMWGKNKVSKCIDILNEWLSRHTFKYRISHYKQMIGWVEKAYYQKFDIDKDDKSFTKILDIDTLWKAKKYIKSVPKELLLYDNDVKYLINKYGEEVLR